MNAPRLFPRDLSLLFLAFLLIASLLIACHPISFLSSSNELDMLSTESGSSTLTEGQTFHSMLQRTGCGDFRNYVWNYMHKLISMGNDILYYDHFEDTIKKRVKELMKDTSIAQENIDNFAEHFATIYKLILEFKKNHQNQDEINNRLIQIEYGDIDEDFSQFINQLKATLNNLVQEAKTFNRDCPVESHIYWSDKSHEIPSHWNIGWFNNMKNQLHPLVYGARKVMSTAYQSCSSLDLPLMPNGDHTRGVQIVGRRGGGRRRAIVNLNAVNQTHYYLKQINIPSSNQCFNVYKSPLIYDYGGKPFATSRSINLFKNARGGDPGLGVDCSGFVTTALASAGLRLKYNTSIKPDHISAVSSWLLKEPKRENFSCLVKQHISSKNPLQPGDIIASANHVVIVDEVNIHNFFSTNSITDISQCHSKNITSDHFHFSIIQSSPINKGVGINRMQFSNAANHMKTITKGMRKVASRICYQKFGKTEHQNIPEVAVLRHNLHEPKCRQQEIHLKNQECLKNCQPQSI